MEDACRSAQEEPGDRRGARRGGKLGSVQLGGWPEAVASLRPKGDQFEDPPRREEEVKKTHLLNKKQHRLNLLNKLSNHKYKVVQLECQHQKVVVKERKKTKVQ